jgi:phosphotransferase system HPr-like phosphotransfer protein
MRNKLILTGQRDCLEFCNKANKYGAEISLMTSDGKYKVNAKSIMGCMLASAEWGDDIWVVSDADLYTAFESWIDESADDGNFIHN